MPRFTGYTTGQTFKGEEVTATQSYAQLATHPVQAVPVGPNDRRTEPSTRPAAGLPGRTAAKGAGAWTQQVRGRAAKGGGAGGVGVGEPGGAPTSATTRPARHHPGALRLESDADVLPPIRRSITR